jgi:hypothetical protein
LLLLGLAACGGVIAADDPDAGGDGDGDGDGDVDAAPVAPNIVFVTLSAHDGAFGGEALADATCQQSASDAGLAGTYVAWLSGPTTDARDKLAGASGWVRVDGEPFANTVDDLLDGRIFYPPALTATGARLDVGLWTATGPDGRYDSAGGNCENWTNSDPGLAQNPTTGASLGGFVRFTADGDAACNLDRRFLCLGVDRAATIEPPDARGRTAFVTAGELNGDVGYDALEALCSTEADSAGLQGSYIAGVSATSRAGTLAPVSARLDLTGEPWVRPDGVALFTTASAMEDRDAMLAPIQLTAEGIARNVDVWTGVADWATTSLNCNTWTSTTTTGLIGRSALGGIAGSSFGSMSCDPPPRAVYCFEN